VSASADDRYKWVALTNTTLAVFMSALDGSIVIISLPAIFRGIHLDPLAPGNMQYLLWMIMGYLLVQAVFVVSLGRLGDMYGRVRIYNLGFVVFTIASVLLSVDPFAGRSGALWLVGWRLMQAFGGAMLTANSVAILADAFPVRQRGLALGINQIAALAGQFIGLVAGGLLAALDWRAVFWVNVPVGVFGTVWAYVRLRDTSERHSGRIDWWGNLTFAGGLSAILIAISFGIEPYGTHATNWSNPKVYGTVVAGIVLLIAFVFIERVVRNPLFELGLFRVRAFAGASVASLASSIARGGLQFMLIIWLQAIWLPLHGYDYRDTPLWSGIFILPLSAGFLVAGPLSGYLSDRFGARGFATSGMALCGASFIGMLFLPVDFSYWPFALLIALNGVGLGMFNAPNTSAIMSSVPARQRGVASGMRATFQNAGSAMSIGLFFSLMIAVLANSLPTTLTEGVQRQGVPAVIAHQIGSLPPSSSLFAAILGQSPIGHLLRSSGVLTSLPEPNQNALTGRELFPSLVSNAFHQSLIAVFAFAAVLAFVACLASWTRAGRRGESADDATTAQPRLLATPSPVD
jgi:MFS family permease